MKTLSQGPYLGINNRLPDFSLRKKDAGDYLREAVNVDITNAGTVVRRKAAVLIQAMTAPHSLFGNYLVRDSVLYRIQLPSYAETFVKALSSNARVSYVEINGDIYFSNGTDSGRIASDGTVFPWALPSPSAPSLSSVAGSLHKGRYQVALSYANATTGEEGGVGAVAYHDLAATGGLRVTLPGAVAGATHVLVYVSTVNGSVPMLAGSFEVGTPTADITVSPTGREANQRHEMPLPAGTRLFEFNGCLCAIKGKDWFIGLPYRHGYCLAMGSRVPFKESVSIAIANQAGVYIAADKTYFFAGLDPAAIEAVRDVLPYGAVPGTEFESPNKSIVGWFGAKGIVLASTQGEVEAVMSDNIDLTPPASGVSAVFETRGYRRVVSCGWCLNLDNLAATTYSGYDFTSASNGYGTFAGGVYSLEGAGKVDAYVRLGKQAFETETEKRLPYGYLGYSADLPLEVEVSTPDDEDYRYVADSCSDKIDVHRVKFGKGLRANWFDLSIFNSGGSDFTLATASFAPLATTRRI